MFRVPNAVAAFVLAATVATAAPAAAMPTELPTEAPKAATAKATGPSKMGAKIERIALSQVGAPYSYGGTTPAGFDCSGFTSWVYSHVGITLPHSSSAQYSLGRSNGFTTISDIAKLKVGDLVFHNTDGSGISHVGIYVGDGEFISATSSEGVQVRSLFDSYWGPKWVGGVRPPR